MASPTVELCSSESSLSEDAALEMTTRGSAVRDRNASGKSDVSKSPTSDTKPKGSHSKKSVSAKASGATTAEDSSEQPSSGRKKRARATPADDMETNSRKSVSDQHSPGMVSVPFLQCFFVAGVCVWCFFVIGGGDFMISCFCVNCVFLAYVLR